MLEALQTEGAAAGRGPDFYDEPGLKDGDKPGEEFVMFAWPDIGVFDACLEASADFG